MQSDGAAQPKNALQLQPPPPPPPQSQLRKTITVASIAAGIQFGWALQLSLLTPYVQLLGIPHTWAAFIWLCGPLSGMIVQPLVGYYSDRCSSRFGRRRPFIAVGAALVAVAVFLIGFAADLGHLSGDPIGGSTAKPRAISVFVIGFWILDVANNTLQGPCRALLADISGGDHRKTRTANSLYSFFMAVGNVLGFAAGSYTHLFKAFPFTKTHACDVYCANLKTCFIFSIALLLTLTTIALTTVSENKLPVSQPEPGNTGEEDEAEKEGGKAKPVPCFGEIFGALKDLPRPMWILLLVTCLNWIAWFPFLLFDTDWMGREVYGGRVGEGQAYDHGVRAGALGLMLNSVVLGFVSLSAEYLARGIGGVKRLWGVVNFLLAVCLAMTVLITKKAEAGRHLAAVHGGATASLPDTGVKVGALTLFAVLGIPLAVTYSIPFALASIFSNTSGAGQGLSLGVLNLAIVIPQVLGDSLEKGKKPASVTIFVLGFWLLDTGNNTLQGPCRAFLADISGNDEAMLRISNAIFAFFMAIGNLIGYGLGSYSNLYKFFPFTKTEACDEHCANLKACFLFSVFILTTITTFAVTLVGEKPLMAPTGRENVAIVIIGDGDDERVVATGFFEQIVLALKSLSKPMWILLFLTSLNWVGWFPFLLYDTDWMGKEVYGGSVEGTAEEIELYYEGVSTGALGLVWYVLTLGITSLAIEPLVQVLGGVKQVWSLGNFLLAVGMVMTVVITSMADHARNVAAVAGNGGSLVLPPSEVRWASLCLFALLGIPQAVTYSLPFALTSIISNSVGAGQGLALGVLNLSIVIPQVVVAMVSGPLDALFGGGNLPAFVMGGVAAVASGVFTLTWLPT